MNKLLFVIAGLFVSLPGTGQNVVRLELKSLPSYHPTGSNIYIAGSFNGWNPQDEKFKFQKDNKGGYFFNLTLDNGLYEYKITRGGWGKVECQKSGAAIENRILKILSDTVISLNIEEWADRFPSLPGVSTASKHVHIIDTVFAIPQLKRTRRIWIYLPENYSTSAESYPVLYMNDGQNLFDDLTSFAGEWGVDEFLDTTLLKPCIVVGIDHGNNKRMNEYNPYDNKRFGKGEGDKYLDFLVENLKPFIDENYRTLNDKENTFIAGSSMGGLISMYAVLRYPGVFGGAGVFSPSFWITDNKIYDYIKKQGPSVNSKIYFYIGGQEGSNMVEDTEKVLAEMKKVSGSKMEIVIKEDGKHNEPTWRKEFPLFYKWIIPYN
jgi:predicted alpha/beta superfamily hydrolase